MAAGTSIAVGADDVVVVVSPVSGGAESSIFLRQGGKQDGKLDGEKGSMNSE